MHDIVRGYISTAAGESYSYAPAIRKVGNGKEVYEVNISQSEKAEDGSKNYVNIRVSIWGKAIPVVQAVVERLLAMPDDKRPQIAFEGEWQEQYVSPAGKRTEQFRAFDASPWVSSYR